MSVEDIIETRIEAAFSDKRANPDPDGDRTEEETIRGEGLTENEVREHDLVEDVIENDDETFTVYVSTESGVYFTST